MTNGILPELSYAGIAELVETTKLGEANRYLKAGYVLLSLGQEAKAAAMPAGANHQFYVRKRSSFVLGRRDDTPAIDVAETAQEAVPA